MVEKDSTTEKFVQTIVLAFLFGYLGVHRFINGKIVSGIFMLSVFLGSMVIGILKISAILVIVLLLISGLWYFIDLVMIIIGDFTNSDGKRVVRED